MTIFQPGEEERVRELFARLEQRPISDESSKPNGTARHNGRRRPRPSGRIEIAGKRSKPGGSSKRSRRRRRRSRRASR